MRAELLSSGYVITPRDEGGIHVAYILQIDFKGTPTFSLSRRRRRRALDLNLHLHTPSRICIFVNTLTPHTRTQHRPNTVVDHQHIEPGDAQVAVAGREVHHPRARAVSPAAAQQTEARQHQQLAAIVSPLSLPVHTTFLFIAAAFVAASFVSVAECFWDENETVFESLYFLFSRSISSSICGTAIWEQDNFNKRRLVSNAGQGAKMVPLPHAQLCGRTSWRFTFDYICWC